MNPVKQKQEGNEDAKGSSTAASEAVAHTHWHTVYYLWIDLLSASSGTDFPSRPDAMS